MPERQGGSTADALLRLAAVLPLPLAHGAGALLGRLAGWLPGRARRVTARNLELCLPELSARERRCLLRRSLVETGKTLAEIPRIWCGDLDAALGSVNAVTGEEPVRAAMAAGRGVIIAGPHLGAWEILGHYLARRYPVTFLFRPARQAWLNRLMCQGRERSGGKLVPTDSHGVRTLFKRLAQGEMIGILPDQDPGYKSGVFVPFFGVPAITMTLLSKLAARSGALVVVTYAERLPGNRGYRVHFEPVDDAIYDPDPTVSAMALNRAVEQAVRRLPEQYQWSYKRFRRRPPGEPGLY